MSSPGAPDIVIHTGPAPRPAAVPAPYPRDRRDPWLRMGLGGVTLPPAGQPGHGRTAFLRRQPARIVDGRVEGGYTGLFELICPCCGDHPYLDYFEIPPRLQWLRGPRTLKAALAAYDKHLGPLPGPNGDSARSLGPHAGDRRVASLLQKLALTGKQAPAAVRGGGTAPRWAGARYRRRRD